MTRNLIMLIVAASASLATLAPASGTPARPRLIVLTDVGGDPDDQQSMIRLMTYSNEFDIEGLVASASGTPGELKNNIVRPELIRQIVDAYGLVRENLLKHSPGYPTRRYLLERIKSGNPNRGVGNLGEGKDTEGSRWIIRLVDRPDPRPVNITIWGGSTELAQALWRVRHDRTAADLKRFVSKIRVCAIAHQDDTGPWIVENFPDLFYVLGLPGEGRDKREAVYRGMYLGGDMSLTSRGWIDEHIRTGHGPLGALYPAETWTAPNPHKALKEGDTPSWFYFLPNGLSDPAHPEWGGWGGRFAHRSGGLYRDVPDRVGDVTDVRAAVWRWRPVFQNDFQARLDWCVKPRSEANHPPVVVCNGDTTEDILSVAVSPGEKVKLSAAGSRDPDGQELSFRWWIYAEASTYSGPASISGADKSEAALTVGPVAAREQLHVVLEATDRGSPPLTGYRRVVVEGR